MSSLSRDPLSQPILQKYGCAGQPLRLYVHARKSVDPQFIGCMRLLAMASNVSKLHRAETIGMMKSWPETAVSEKRIETAAAELAINALQTVLNRLSSSSNEIRQRYGQEAVAAHPALRVREAETMIAVSLLKSMKELQLIGSNDYIFEALRESTAVRRKQRGRRKSAKSL